MWHRSRGNGITLLELLIVISILSLLAALLFPVFAGAREKSRQAVCVSNLKQLLVAFDLYTMDYDGYLPGDGSYDEASVAGWVLCVREWWIDVVHGALYPYTHSAAVYTCRSGRSELTYSMNEPLGLAFLDQVTYPSETVFLIDEAEHEEEGHSFPNDGVFLAERGVDWLTDRHNGGGNVGFCDGHVQWREATRRWDVRQFDPWR